MKIGKTIAFIGGGNMAEALIKGILRAGLFEPGNIVVSDTSAERRDYLKKEYGVQAVSGNVKALDSAGIVVLAVKPQVISGVLAEMAGRMTGQMVHAPLVISVAAGVSIETISAVLGKSCRIIRAMPNTPALVLAGAAALAAGSDATGEDIETAMSIFSAVGKAFVVDEKLMDAVTGLSGSGPAYIFTIIDAMADGGVKMGLPRNVALQLAAQTTLGAALMTIEMGKHPAVLKEMVTSPGGTTIAGLHRLEDGGIRAALISAVEAATLRSRELGRREG